MERTGATVVDGGGAGARAPRYGWQGATLRPTGVVVFATLDPVVATPARAGFHPAELQGRARPALGSGGADAGLGRPAPGHAGVTVPAHQWRWRMARSAAWLLGR